jgi:hypothetical protein
MAGAAGSPGDQAHVPTRDRRSAAEPDPLRLRPAGRSRTAAIADGALLRRAQASAFKVASSGWPSKYLRNASAKILSGATVAKSVIDERNFRSSGLPKI